MKIWLVGEGPLPINGERLERTGNLAKYLSKKGHDVIWWASTFDHANKRYSVKGPSEYQLNDNEKLILVHSEVAYKKNKSLARIKYHNQLSANFLEMAEKYNEPEIILCAWPSPQLAGAAADYGEKHGVPVVVDIKDMWPDIFTRVFPQKLEPITKVLLKPMKKTAARTLSKMSGITGVMPHVIKWGCNYANRVPCEKDKYFFLTTEKIIIDDKEYKRQLEWWQQQGVDEKTWNIVFFSTLSKTSLDLGTVIKAIRGLSAEYPDIKLIIGGKGDDEKRLRKIAGDNENIVFAGWLDENQMNSVMKISKCGMYCLRNTLDFKDTFSNKAVQYLSAGLPIISSLEGFAKGFLADNSIGITYEEGRAIDCKNKIMELYENESKRKEMSANAIDVFTKNFEANIVNERFEKYLESFVHDGLSLET